MQRFAPVAALLPLAVACCSESTVSNPLKGPAFGFESGTRLRARVRVGEGGSRLLVGWRDSKLGAPCRFATAEDGATRCIPEGVDVVFLDAACTQPIGARDPSCGPPASYASVTMAGETCNGVTHAFRIKELLVPITERVYVGGSAGAGCTRSGKLDERIETYALEPMDPLELVEATLAREPKSDHLGLEVLVAKDGARQPRSLYDATHGRCFSIAGALGGGEDRCIPDAVAWATYAADPACKERVAYQLQSGTSCPRADVVVDYAFEDCGVRTRFFATGADVKLDDVYTASPPTCAPVRSQPSLYASLKRDHVFYRIADPIAASTFPKLRTTPLGPGRLAVPTLATDDGTALAPARPDTFFDTNLGTPCRVYPFPDRINRCVPADAATIAEPTYDGDECTHEVVGIARVPGCPSAAIPTYAMRVTGDACGSEIGARAVHRLGTVARDLSTYFVKNEAGNCTPRPGAGDVFVDVLGEVPPDDLGLIAEAIE